MKFIKKETRLSIKIEIGEIGEIKYRMKLNKTTFVYLNKRSYN